MLGWIQAHLIETLAAMTALAVIGLVLAVIALGANSALKKRTKKWKSIHATADLEQVYAQTLDEVEQLRASFRLLESELSAVKRQMRRKISTARVLRYNAFAEQGSDLSFSVALLDDEQEGVVLSSIYGREESRTYAKPVKSGTSKYPLTNEEIEAVSEVAVSREGPSHGKD